MNRKPEQDNQAKQGKNEGALEKMAQIIDPPSREISDDELADPGNNIASSNRTLNESGAGLDRTSRRPSDSK